MRWKGSGPAGSTLSRPNLLPVYQWLVALTSALILIQAVFAGRYLFAGLTLTWHEMLANILFLVAVVQVGLTWYLGIPGALGRRLLILNGLLVLLIVVQIALGYSGDESRQALSWHVPNGVLIFGLTVAIASLVAQIRGEPESR
jgi:hypothetical protein